MATEVKLPRLGQGMESGTIVRWLVSEGDPVEKGDVLYELDTEKVTQEVEAEASGVLLKIAVAEGEVDVGRTVAFIGDEGEEVDASADGGPGGEAGGDGSPAASEQQEAEDGAEESAEKPAEGPERDAERERGRQAAAEAARQEEPSGNGATRLDGGRVKASPLARRIAREKGVELSSVSGTGPEGRIVAEDVERAAAAPAPSAAPARTPGREAEPEVVPLTSTRRTIARRLTEAWEAPVFQLSLTADMTRMLEVRELLLGRLQEGETRPTVNDLLTKVCAAALVRHPAVNAHFTGDAVERYSVAHVGIAVAAPAGLVVPVIRDADRLTVQEIAAARAEVVGRAREGKLRREDLEGGTFTISNLGMFGIEGFIAVLNPPQAAILAVGSTEERPVVVDGALEILPTVQLTLTCDHRAIDGAEGAEFLATVQGLVEEPALAL